MNIMPDPPYWPKINTRTQQKHNVDLNADQLHLLLETTVRVLRDGKYYDVVVSEHYTGSVDQMPEDIALDCFNRFNHKCMVTKLFLNPTEGTVYNLQPSVNQMDEEERLKQHYINDPTYGLKPFQI